MMRRYFAVFLVVGLLAIVGCGSARDAMVSSESPVNTPEDAQVGESELEREADKIALTFEACCVTPGNAYTAWWLIGDVELPMSAVDTPLAEGWIAESEDINLKLELKVGEKGFENTNDGLRLVILDHGPDTGNSSQLNTPSGGCRARCPEVLRTSHPAP